MFRKFALMISTFIGLLSAFSSGTANAVPSTDLKVQFSQPNLLDEPAISSPNEEKDFLQLKDATSLIDEPALVEKLLEPQTSTPRQQAPIEPCPACGMG